MLAVPRKLWDEVGGFDERFVGWGGEDNAFWHACTVISGAEPARVPGYAYHLWHPAASNKRDAQYRTNRELWRRYSAANTEADIRRIRPRGN
jgi:predicted glycosyltransferase involved in capsule biosynthesis